MTEHEEAKKMPKFKSDQEAGDFWDSHSPEEFPGEFQEVKTRFSRPLIKRGLTIKLTEATIDELREMARRRGIGPTTLARMWILEHLQEVKEREIEKPRSQAS